MQKTPNYNLPQFQSTDQIYKEDLNNAYLNIDTAIGDLQEAVNSVGTPGNDLQITADVITARKGKSSLVDEINSLETYKSLNDFPVQGAETDDTARLQRAVDYIISTGGCLLLNQDLNVSGAINIKKQGVANVRILSTKRIKITKTTGNYAIFDIGSTVVATSYANRIQKVFIENILFESPDSTGSAIKLRNFGYVFINNVDAYRFNTAYDIAGGSELFIDGMIWAGGNLGLQFNVDDGLGGSGSGIDLQVIKIKNAVFSNGLKNVKIIDGRDITFDNCEFIATGTNKNIEITTTQHISFAGCYFEWQNSSPIDCNNFNSLEFNKGCEFAYLSGTNTSPVYVKSTNVNAIISVNDCYFDGLNLPAILLKTGSVYPKINNSGNFPMVANLSVSLEGEQYPYSSLTTGFKCFNNEYFLKELCGINQDWSSLTCTFNTTTYLTGVGSLQLSSASSSYTDINLNKVYDDNAVIIDAVIYNNNHSDGIFRAVEKDYAGNSYVVAMRDQGGSILTQTYGNWKRYRMFYKPTSGRYVQTIRISNSLYVGTDITIDYLDIRTLKDTNMPKELKYKNIPSSGSWNVGDRIYPFAPVASGYIGQVCIATSPLTFKGFGLIQS